MALKNILWSGILDYPTDFHSVPDSEINGVGPKNFGKLVDDYIFGVNIRESARIHDACWFLKMEQREADKKFLRNMMEQIYYEPEPTRRIGARFMAYVYYFAVRVGGLVFY